MWSKWLVWVQWYGCGPVLQGIPSGWLHQPRQLCGARTWGRWVCAVWRYLGIWLAFVVWTDVLLIHLEIKKKKKRNKCIPVGMLLWWKQFLWKAPRDRLFSGRQAPCIFFFLQLKPKEQAVLVTVSTEPSPTPEQLQGGAGGLEPSHDFLNICTSHLV